MKKQTKRYQLSLDEERAEELKRIIKELGLPPGTFSAIISESLPGMIKMFKAVLDKRQSGEQMTMEDVMGTTLMVLGEEMRKER